MFYPGLIFLLRFFITFTCMILSTVSWSFRKRYLARVLFTSGCVHHYGRHREHTLLIYPDHLLVFSLLVMALYLLHSRVRNLDG
jgi:hypothetical protein